MIIGCPEGQGCIGGNLTVSLSYESLPFVGLTGVEGTVELVLKHPAR
jgi:hypothetical protein